MRGILGPDSWDTKEVIILNRVLRWTPKGLEYEADPRHVEIITSELCLENSNPVVTPGVKDQLVGQDEPLPAREATRIVRSCFLCGPLECEFRPTRISRCCAAG